MSKTSFYIGLGVITIVIFIIFNVVFSIRPEYTFPLWFVLPAFFILITVATHEVLTKALKGRPGMFTSYYMGTMAVKLFLCMMVMLGYVLLYKKHAVPFLIATLILYFIFTFFEVSAILKANRKS